MSRGLARYVAKRLRFAGLMLAGVSLVMMGRHDWICPVDQAEEIHRLIPHFELAVFERSGHSPQIEEREAFTRRLAVFLAAADLERPRPTTLP